MSKCKIIFDFNYNLLIKFLNMFYCIIIDKVKRHIINYHNYITFNNYLKLNFIYIFNFIYLILTIFLIILRFKMHIFNITS